VVSEATIGVNLGTEVTSNGLDRAKSASRFITPSRTRNGIQEMDQYGKRWVPSHVTKPVLNLGQNQGLAMARGSDQGSNYVPGFRSEHSHSPKSSNRALSMVRVKD
jgi:hypothetical protein